MAHPQLSFYQVVYEPCPPVLLGVSDRNLTGEEITESCELLLSTAVQHECPYWLLDGRRHARDQPQGLHDWMREDYFPRVRTALGQRPCVAFLVPAFVWEGLPSKGYDSPLDWHAPGMQLGWFTEENPAREWLGRQRAPQANSGVEALQTRMIT